MAHWDPLRYALATRYRNVMLTNRNGTDLIRYVLYIFASGLIAYVFYQASFTIMFVMGWSGASAEEISIVLNVFHFVLYVIPGIIVMMFGKQYSFYALPALLFVGSWLYFIMGLDERPLTLEVVDTIISERSNSLLGLSAVTPFVVLFGIDWIRNQVKKSRLKHNKSIHPNDLSP